ncbi:MAG: hypothetical protein FWD53_00380 [Phycisphaerales bacterium]|nr:hypothetical protein [Phycisphaerales bacterium]
MTTTAAAPTPPTVTELATRIAELEAQVAELRREQEFEQISASIDRGLEQADRGQTTTMEEFIEHMSKKYNLPRPKWMTDAT